MSLLAKIDQLPPFIAFALARKGRKRPTLDELVKASGLSLRTFTRIARKFSWGTVKASQIDAFCRACDVDLLCQYRQREFIKRATNSENSFSHLSARQRKTFDRQCSQWLRLKA